MQKFCILILYQKIRQEANTPDQQRKGEKHE